MPSPDPEGIGLLAKVAGAAVAIVGPVWGVRTWLDRRFEKKADKTTVKASVDEIKLELGVQRGHIGKLFDVIRESDQKSEERHRELLMHMVRHNGDGK